MNGPPVKRNRLTGLAGSAGVEAGMPATQDRIHIRI